MEQNVPFPQRRALNCDFDCNINQNTNIYHKYRQKKNTYEERKMKLVKTGTKKKKRNEKKTRFML